MKKTSLYYATHHYQSHQRVARDYCRIIDSNYHLIRNRDTAVDAEIVFLHFEPHDYGAFYKRYPLLTSKYVIAYCVWEADNLPDTYKKSLSHVQEVWTCSRYCETVFSRYHPRVKYIPHIIDRDTGCADSDRDRVRRAVDYEPGCYYFLTITMLSNLRKNTETLVRVFRRYSDAMPGARLIVKAYPEGDVSWEAHPRVIYLREVFTESQINCLYEIADAYVSAHHSEGWGLTMSDAMIFRKPVIATGYSGNMEFMSCHNSFPVKCSIETIRPADRYYLFGAGMKWAYVDEENLGELMVSLVNNRQSRYVLDKIDRASIDIRAFDSQSVGQQICSRLDQIIAGDL